MSALIVDGSHVGVDEGVEAARAQVHACQSAGTLQVEMAVTVAHDALYGIAEKRVGAVGVIDVGCHPVAAVAVESHARGNPDLALFVGIDTAHREVGQSLRGAYTVEGRWLSVQLPRRRDQEKYYRQQSSHGLSLKKCHARRPAGWADRARNVKRVNAMVKI